MAVWPIEKRTAVAFFNELERMLLASAQEMARHQVANVRNGSSVRSSDAPLPSDHEIVVATISFSAATVTGSISLLSPRSVARRLQPPDLALPADVADKEVIGELANMLAGRLKNHLLSRGVAATIATPTTGIARSMRLRECDAMPSCRDLPTGRGSIFMHLQTAGDGDDVVLQDEGSIDFGCREGDVILFADDE